MIASCEPNCYDGRGVTAASTTPGTRRRKQNPASSRRTAFLNNRGALLLETIIAVGIFMTVGVTALVAVSTIQKSRGALERQATAETLARNQMEYILSLDYQTPPFTFSYPSSTSISSGFSVTAMASTSESFPAEPDIEKITVIIRHGGNEVLKIETLRANR